MAKTPTKTIALVGVMAALSIALSYLESMIPAVPGLPPGVKLGLSNVVTMYSLFFVGVWPAVLIVLAKSLFAMLLRGSMAGIFSLCGGLCSVAVMAALVALNKRKERISPSFISVFGAVFHNIGQLLAAWLFMSTLIVWYYAPVLVISGVVMGLVTGVVLNVVAPAIRRVENRENGRRQGG